MENEETKVVCDACEACADGCTMHESAETPMAEETTPEAAA